MYTYTKNLFKVLEEAGVIKDAQTLATKLEKMCLDDEMDSYQRMREIEKNNSLEARIARWVNKIKGGTNE
jgi:hypothetical protein